MRVAMEVGGGFAGMVVVGLGLPAWVCGGPILAVGFVVVMGCGFCGGGGSCGGRSSLGW
uniref:Transmembrane protein n=1 Tax=Fagus sylvatica TaxID=28930 RepID=A0A2N9EHH8_FAGSY